MKRLMIVIIITIALGFLPAMVTGGQWYWIALLFARDLQVLVWVWCAFMWIPYSKLMAKTTAYIFFLLCILDVATTPVYFVLPPILVYTIIVIAMISWLIWAAFRRYDEPSDELDGVSMFRVSIRPRSFQDFLISLFKDPVGGVGVYADDKFYHYRKGRLVVNNRSYLLRTRYRYLIKRIRLIDSDRVAELEKLNNTKWTWTRNCITQLRPIVGDRGRPYFSRG